MSEVGFDIWDEVVMVQTIESKGTVIHMDHKLRRATVKFGGGATAIVPYSMLRRK